MKTRLLPLGCALLLSSGVSFARADVNDITPPPPVIYLEGALTNTVKTNGILDAWIVYPADGGGYALQNAPVTGSPSTNTVATPSPMPGAPTTAPSASTNAPVAPPPAPTSAPGEQVPEQIQSTPTLQGDGAPTMPPI